MKPQIIEAITIFIFSMGCFLAAFIMKKGYLNDKKKTSFYGKITEKIQLENNCVQYGVFLVDNNGNPKHLLSQTFKEGERHYVKRCPVIVNYPYGNDPNAVFVTQAPLIQNPMGYARVLKFIGTLFFCLMAYPAFLEDVWEFIATPILWAWDNLSIYAKWMATPYYSKFVDGSEKLFAYSAGTAWILRILSLALLIAGITGIHYGMYKLWLYYRKRWCNLSLKVLLISLAVMIVFGSGIKSIMSINLVLLLGIIQIVYLVALIYLDVYFERRNKSRVWIQVQNM